MFYFILFLFRRQERVLAAGEAPTRLSEIDAQSNMVISRGADLARTVLHIAAEDDSLVSHSSVPLLVDAFVERLDGLSLGFCSLYMPRSDAPPKMFLANLERYFYVHKV